MISPARAALFLLPVVAILSTAQSPTANPNQAQQARERDYWIDPSTRLMWAGKDNGKDVSWKKAVKYCRDLRLAGYSDWRLASLPALEGIYDESLEAAGLMG